MLNSCLTMLSLCLNPSEMLGLFLLSKKIKEPCPEVGCMTGEVSVNVVVVGILFLWYNSTMTF